MKNSLPEKLAVYEDARRNAFISALNLKSAGGSLCGIFGFAFPKEIVWAADMVPVNVFSIDDSNTAAAEQLWGKEYCSLLKASYGYAVTGKCPFMYFSDLIAMADFCKAKHELLDKLAETKNIYKLDAADDLEKLAASYHKFAAFLEEEFAVSITEAKLESAIKQSNTVNKQLHKLISFYQANPHVLGCLDFYNITYGSSFIFDLQERRRMLVNLLRALQNMALEMQAPLNPKTVLLTGAPQAGLREKILKPLQEILQDTAVICFSTCEGEYLELADEKPEPYMALAQKYINCQTTLSVETVIQKFKAAAVIDVVLTGCCKSTDIDVIKNDIPCLHLETDYTEADTQKTAVAIAEFIKAL